MLDEGRRVLLLRRRRRRRRRRHVDRPQRYSVAAHADCAPDATCAQKRCPIASHVFAAADFVDVQSGDVDNGKCWNAYGVRLNHVVRRWNTCNAGVWSYEAAIF